MSTVNTRKRKFNNIRRSEKACFLLCSITSVVAIMIMTWIYKNDIMIKVKAYTEQTTQVIETTVPETTEPQLSVNAVQEFTKTTESVKNSTEFKLPVNTVQETEAAKQEHTAIPTEPTFPISHTVVEGDTWGSISTKYFDDDKYAEGISYLNGERNLDDFIYVGETITVENEHKLKAALVDSDINNNYYVFNAGPFGEYTDGHPNPSIDIKIPKDNNGRNFEGEVDTSGFEYQGDFTITGYAPYCSHCCGGEGITASGATAVNGYTVASGMYPFGTTLYIEGYGFYVVEDTGSAVSGYHLDIAAPDHESCYDLTNTGVSVYLVPNNNDKV